jgi:hypothetical protein
MRTPRHSSFRPPLLLSSLDEHWARRFPSPEQRKEKAMPLYMDVHKHISGLTKEAAEGAHQRDLEVQERHDVKYLKYWFNEKNGDVFCLIEAPDKESAIRVHQEAHGLLADEIIEVQEGV